MSTKSLPLPKSLIPGHQGSAADHEVLPSRPEPPRAQREMLRPLTGVRAVAAIWVVVGHFTPHITALFPGFRYLRPLTANGYLGVDLFFVLSGFILSHNYLHEFRSVSLPKYKQFLWLRLARMYPVHLFTMLILLAGVLVGTVAGIHFNMPARLGTIDFIRNLLLVHAWGFADDTSWNGPAWSISAEWCAYLLFPLIALGAVRIARARMAGLGAALMYVILFALLAIVGCTFDTLDNDLALVRVMTQFIAGCLLYRVYESGLRRSLRWDSIALAIALGIVVYAFIFPPERLISLAPAPALAILVLALSLANGPVAAFHASRLMVFWGEVSYSLYMTHDLVRMALNKTLNVDRYMHSGAATRAAVLAMYAAAVAGAAVATYFVVEKPARRWMRGLAGKGKPVDGEIQQGQKFDGDGVEFETDFVPTS